MASFRPNRWKPEFMNKSKNKAWNTKYGPRRVRNDAPTLQEAIAAAQGLSDETDEQADIAAALMGLPREQVRAELLKAGPARKVAAKSVAQSVAFVGSASAPRTIVVERKPSRRAAAGRMTRSAI